MHCGIFFCFCFLFFSFVKTPKWKLMKSTHLLTSKDCDGRHANFEPGPCYFASTCFVWILICLQFFLKEENRKFVVCGERKMHYGNLKTLLTLYIVHMFKFFIYFVHKPFCFAGICFLFIKRGVFLFFFFPSYFLYRVYLWRVI